jgi:hypothetical protein
MNTEQRLAEAIQSFHLDALAGAVALNVDFDVTLSALAHTVCAALRRRLPGYHAVTLDTLQRRFLKPAGSSSTTARRSWSASTGTPTHPSCAGPASPRRSSCPGGKTGPPLRVHLMRLGAD